MCWPVGQSLRLWGLQTRQGCNVARFKVCQLPAVRPGFRLYTVAVCGSHPATPALSVADREIIRASSREACPNNPTHDNSEDRALQCRSRRDALPSPV